MCPAETGSSWFHIKLCQLSSNTWAVYTSTIKCIGWKIPLTVREQTPIIHVCWESKLDQSSSVRKTPPTSVWSALNQTVVLMHTPRHSTIEDILPVNVSWLANILVIKALDQAYSQLLFLNAKQHRLYLG